MNDSLASLLIDTNVWLDNYIPDRANSPYARSLFSTAQTQGIQLLYAVESIKDVFYMVAADFKAKVRAQGASVGAVEAEAARQLAWSCIENMRELACAVGADESDVWLASKYRALHDDFEDDLILAAARRAQADYLITGDIKLIEKSTVPALTPQSWLALQDY